MTVPYRSVLKQVALQVNALRGTQVEGLETSYITSPITRVEIAPDSPFPFSRLKDALLNAEEELVLAIANNPVHPWRSYLFSVTNSIASGGTLPTLDLSSKSIVGVYGDVTDVSDFIICTEQPPTKIIRRNRNPGTFYKVNVYWYHINSQRIIHTRTNVKIDVCVYDQPTQVAALDAGNMLLPDALEQAMVAGAVSHLFKEDQFIAQAAAHRKYFEEQLAAIKVVGDVT